MISLSLSSQEGVPFRSTLDLSCRCCEHHPRFDSVSSPPAIVPRPFALGHLIDTALPFDPQPPIRQLFFLSHPNSWLTQSRRSYTDGEIVRQGPQGDQGDGAYSAGVSFFRPSLVMEVLSTTYHPTPLRHGTWIRFAWNIHCLEANGYVLNSAVEQAISIHLG